MSTQIRSQESERIQIVAKSTLNSAVRGSPGFIVLALGHLPNLGILILSIIATDGLIRVIFLLPAILIVGFLLWELWAIATLQLAVDEHGLHWHAAKGSVRVTWDDIWSVAYTQNGSQIRLITSDNKTVRLVTVVLPKQELVQIKQLIAKRVPADKITTIPSDKHSAQLNVAISILFAASFFAAYVVAKLYLVEESTDYSLLSLWIGLYFLIIAVPLVPTLLVAGVYWLARRKIMRGTAWILGFVWLLFVGFLLIVIQLAEVRG